MMDKYKALYLCIKKFKKKILRESNGFLVAGNARIAMIGLSILQITTNCRDNITITWKHWKASKSRQKLDNRRRNYYRISFSFFLNFIPESRLKSSPDGVAKIWPENPQSCWHEESEDKFQGHCSSQKLKRKSQKEKPGGGALYFVY